MRVKRRPGPVLQAGPVYGYSLVIWSIEPTEVPVWIQPGTFRLAPPEVPIWMIGPGTGVAPFRSFVRERLVDNAAGMRT